MEINNKKTSTLEDKLKKINEKKSQLEARRKILLKQEKEKQRNLRTKELIQCGAIIFSALGEVPNKNMAKALVEHMVETGFLKENLDGILERTKELDKENEK